MAEYLLSDAQMREFIVNGFVTVTTELSAAFHDAIYEKTMSVFDKEGNPGNNLLPRIPEIQQIFEDPNVRGALTSLLGPDYYMQPHRHPHYNPPGSKGQGLHQDGGKRWSHHTRRLLAFYYPQDTPVELGPTGVCADESLLQYPRGCGNFAGTAYCWQSGKRLPSQTTIYGTVRCQTAARSGAI